MLNKIILVLIAAFWFPTSYCWSQQELDLFDLVEEINENFYNLLQIPQDAPMSDIRRSYRRLSLQYHPDKNRDDPNASETFRKIGAVAEVLRDEEARAMYDSVLEHGLPDWRQPVYYYRRVRKMSLIELTILLVIIIIIGQLLYGWAQYAEKQLVLYELRERKEKKDRKAKGRKNTPTQMTKLDSEVLYYEAVAKAALPHYTKLFPYVLVKNTLHYIVVLCCLMFALTQKLRRSDAIKATTDEEIEEDTSSLRSSKHYNRKRRNEVNKSTVQEEEVEKAVDLVTERAPVNTNDTANSEKERELTEEEEKERRTCLIENEKELRVELDQIEESMIEDWSRRNKRSKKPHSNKIKSHLADKSLEYQQQEESIVKENYSEEEEEEPATDKTQWNQYQQKQLEWALKEYSKEENRWELIAEVVPGKTKDECIVRYRELVELVRNRKSQ